MSGVAAAQRVALRAAFGASDSDEEACAPSGPAPRAEQHAVVEGLALLRGFLSTDAQAALLAAVRAHGWAPAACGDARDQSMHFGYAALPRFARQLADDVAAAAAAHGMLPPALAARTPAFNQVICNSYAPGQGIAAHVDLAAFGDGIASVSLGAAAVMDWRHVSDGREAAVLLQPGDLMTLHGAARYEWTHGCAHAKMLVARCAPLTHTCRIAARQADEWGGAVRQRGHRVSLTLRRMAADVHVLSHEA